jgi:release factor glutamine methyltransferase
VTATLLSTWTDLRKRFEAAGIDTPVIDARLLLEAGAGVARIDIVTDPYRELTSTQVAAVEALAARRLAREPVAHIIGRKAFWSIDLAVTPDVLIPRPETELVVDTALKLMTPDAALRVLDLGVGSGAILFALLSERPKATGVGIDASAAALDVARRNATALGLDARAVLRAGDWGEGVGERFDIVVSNPPYIAAREIAELSPEVQREPRLALEGGDDGLAAYRIIAPQMSALLKPGGGWALEVGRGQAEQVAALCSAAGLTPQPPRADLGGISRVVWGQQP